MIESTEAERQAYVRAILIEQQIVEAIRLRQKYQPTWIKVERLYDRLISGLQCNRSEARLLLRPLLLKGVIELNKTKRYLCVVGGAI